jgi:hypothetical protein
VLDAAGQLLHAATSHPADGWRDERIAADPHVCPTGLRFGVGVHEATLRVNVRWVTPLGEETASMS